MKKITLLLVCVLALSSAPTQVYAKTCCTVPDNGSGTIDFPPDCPYDHPSEPMMIIDGLPPMTTIELWGPLTDFYNVVNTPGGTLGGEICTFDAYLDWTVTGTGDLEGFNRHLYVPVSGEIHIGPRTPGDSVQSFSARIDSLFGQLFGDPDFCELIVRAGTDYGMPCAGHTVLTELPSGEYAVDSFFDVVYEVQFEGCPGSPLADLNGVTRDAVPRLTCYDTTYTVDWCRLQWPHTVEDWPGQPVTVYGRVYIAGLTDQTTGNDPVPGVVRGQVGYGPRNSDPSIDPGWAWTEAVPNPGWDGGVAGEPNNDEYWATLVTPAEGGNYDFAYRFSGDMGSTWLYGDKDTGVPGEDGSENGYQPENAGKMSVRHICCVAPDNGSGTIDFPANCPYDNPGIPMKIIDGLPPLTTIELWGPLTDFYNVVNSPGGSLGGEKCTFDAYLDWTVEGTGSLAGFNRHLYVPVSGEIHIAPRTPGDSIQTFEARIFRLTGELFGDPDFCTLRFTAGSDSGMPGPGMTTLTELPSGDFAVDSFFDITYEVEFEGCPGSVISDYSGTTRDSVPRMTCYEVTYTVDWCRLQWPHTIEEWPGTGVTVYGRVFIAGLTDQTTGNDPVPGIVRGQVGYGPRGTDPSVDPGWAWTEAVPNPGWDGVSAGEPDNDEYMATLTTPVESGDYDFAFRFSGDVGGTWLYGDKDTGVPGEDGSENGYQPANAGKMTVRDVCCIAPDNGSGTIDFPPDCPYGHPFELMMIIDGLPAGTTIELDGPLTDFYNMVNTPGGTLGGEICTFDAYLDWTVTGTGDLEGFNRHLYVPVSGEIHIGPRTPGDSLQSFAAKIDSLFGQLFGDPDFCELIVRAGTDYGMPCAGHTVLTELPSGDFAVDSFFDITYEVQFEGCPGSPLSDFNGTTRDEVPRSTCYDTTYTVDWCRLQWPHTIEDWPGQAHTVYGRVYIAGLTDQTTGNDAVPGVVRGQVGYGPRDSDPATDPGWTWTEAFPNPGWDGGVAGEPNNDEYWVTIMTPAAGGDYDFACRFSGDVGSTWLYGDKDTGISGEDGSENGYQPVNAGKMFVTPVCCVAPDNGSGTIDFPANCPYNDLDEPMMIIDGLPAGTTIELWGPWTNFTNVVNTPGGSLGGEVCSLDAEIVWHATGTGELEGFDRNLVMPVSGVIHIGSRTPGDSVQTFPADLVHLAGQLFGDPDFCTLIITAGTDNGLPSPGEATLTELPSGDFAVDSFFDITYTIEFEGCPASPIQDYNGTTLGIVRRSTCWELAGVPVDDGHPEHEYHLSLGPAVPNPFGSFTTIPYSIPGKVGNSRITIKIYDARGRLIRVLVDTDQTSGTYQAYWDGRNHDGVPVSSGIYFCRLSTYRGAVSQRIVLLK